MRKSTQRSIGARKFSSASVQAPKSGSSSVGVAIPSLPFFSGIPPSVIITSRDDAPRTQKFVISISDKSFHTSFKNEQSFHQAIDEQPFQFSNIQPITIEALVQFCHSV